MDFIQIAQFILSLSILVVLHELGHFIPAKLFKTRVDKFYLFFDPWFSIFKKKIGETEYGIGWLPLGGYVKIAGMVDESMDTDALKEEPKPWEFRSKTVFQRFIIMVGGVTVNFILGFLIYIMVFYVWGKDVIKPADLTDGYAVSSVLEKYGMNDGDKVTKINGIEVLSATEINRELLLRNIQNLEILKPDNTVKTIKIPEDIGTEIFNSGERGALVPRFKFQVGEVKDAKKEVGAIKSFLINLGIKDEVTDFPAKKAGILAKDKIIAANGKPIVFFDDFQEISSQNKNKEINLLINRSGKEINLKITPNQDGICGIVSEPLNKKEYKITNLQYSFIESISEGSNLAILTLKDYYTQFKYVFTKKGSEEIGGFAAMSKLYTAGEWDWQTFWTSTALISLILAFMNLLPIPALDGGHIVFLLYEAITGKEPPQKVLEYAQLAGFILLMSLMLYANGNDFFKGFIK